MTLYKKTFQELTTDELYELLRVSSEVFVVEQNCVYQDLDNDNLAKMFFELPHPWNIVYEVVSNGFFVLWAIRIWCIRNNYFKIIEQ